MTPICFAGTFRPFHTTSDHFRPLQTTSGNHFEPFEVRMQHTNQTYTPYGQAGGDDLLGAGAIAPKLASAADDDDDDDGPDGR